MSRLIVAATILGSLSLLEYLSSAAPLPVHLAMLSAAVVGFFLPALFIGSPAQYRARWLLVALASLAGALLYGWLTSLAVVKAEFTYLWYLKYPVIAAGFAVLLLVHALLTGAVARRTAAAN